MNDTRMIVPTKVLGKSEVEARHQVYTPGNARAGRILVVDDEQGIRDFLLFGLRDEGYDVLTVKTGEEALDALDQFKPHVVLLDIMLPGMDGFEVCRVMKERARVSIIILTAKDDIEERVKGLAMGADDYVVKPFSPRELVMRVKALLRRTGNTVPETVQPPNLGHILTFPGLVINVDARKVLVEEIEVSLTPKEFELLLYLAQRPEKVFSREELLRDVWNYQFFGDQRTVDTHVKRLREKLGRLSDRVPQHIHTVWGVGYKFEVVE